MEERVCACVLVGWFCEENEREDDDMGIGGSESIGWKR